MARAREHLFTIDDFVAFEDGTGTRYELHGGRIVAMAPAAQAHGELVMRLGPILGRNLQPPCRVISEAGIPVRDGAESYYQADLVVTCEPRERGRLWVEQPKVVVEVLSPSTAATDFERKLPDYRRIASLRHILLVDSERARVHHLTRDGDRWVIGDVGPGERLRLDAIGVELDVDQLYRDIPLEDDAPGAAP